jgi:transposase InsO family protein
VRSCDSCQRNKSRNQLPIGVLNSLEVPTHRLEQVTLDFVMELSRTSSGYDAIVVIVDRLSKIVRFCPTTSDVDAVGSAKLFFNNWYRHYGLPRKILSDRDGRFVGKFWLELFRLTQVRLTMSSSHHPQTDGQTERTNRTMDEMLRH